MSTLFLHVIRPIDALVLCNAIEGKVAVSARLLSYATDMMVAMVAARQDVEARDCKCCLCLAPVLSCKGVTYCAVMSEGQHRSHSIVCSVCTEEHAPDALYAACGDSLSDHLLSNQAGNVHTDVGHA